MKYMKEFLLHFRERPVFSIRDARIFLKKKKISPKYLHLFLHHVLKKKTMHRITKGAYTFKDDLVVSGFAFSPFYYGLHYALFLHGIQSQAANPVIITAKKARSGVRTVMGANIVVRKISPKMFFGFEHVKHYDYWIPISTPEKTLIDFFYFRQKIPKKELNSLAKKTDSKLLKKFLRKAPKWVQKRAKKLLEAYLGE